MLFIYLFIFNLWFSLGPIIISLENVGIRKYNDMKEHSISRIHSSCHPSLVNTHQSLCAHNLITKHVTAAKQPPHFRGLLQTQTRGDGCLYSWKKMLKNVNVRTVEKRGGKFTSDSCCNFVDSSGSLHCLSLSASLRPVQLPQRVLTNSPTTWWAIMGGN